jgi:succinylarginine dihydrolase
MNACEINFDGLVGPTHNYAGLSHGNVASMTHGGAVSNPREAALQGLAKMKFLADLGLKQAVLPPHERPSLETLRALGFAGSDAEVLRAAAKHAPKLLVACSSASNMWVANAATVAPSADTADGRAHFTPANLVAKFHRSIEPPQTARTLRAIFRDEARFAVHDPVPGGQAMGDEGAANHTRLAPTHGHYGLHFFVYGHRALGAPAVKAAAGRFPSRQALEASEAVARRHGLGEDNTVFAQQAPAAIDAGVFHNDVICVGNENVLLYHEQAFIGTAAVVADLRRYYVKLNPGGELIGLRVPARQVPLHDAVKSYLFNSQLVTLPAGGMALIAPSDCAETPRVRDFLRELIARDGTPVRQVHYFDLKQSMRNGGGPACLRLRVVLNDAELAALPPGVFLHDRSYARLTAWVKKHYRDRLTHADLADPQLLDETRRALDELTRILGLGRIYPFQSEKRS